MPFLAIEWGTTIVDGEDVFLSVGGYPILIHLVDGVLCWSALRVDSFGEEGAKYLPSFYGCAECVVGFLGELCAGLSLQVEMCSALGALAATFKVYVYYAGQLVVDVSAVVAPYLATAFKEGGLLVVGVRPALLCFGQWTKVALQRKYLV